MRRKDGDGISAEGIFRFTDEEIAGFLANEKSYYVVAKKGVEYEEVQKFEEYCKTDEGSMSLESITKSGMYVSIRTKNLRAICLDLPSAEMSACMASRSIITAS